MATTKTGYRSTGQTGARRSGGTPRRSSLKSDGRLSNSGIEGPTIRTRVKKATAFVLPAGSQESLESLRRVLNGKRGKRPSVTTLEVPTRPERPLFNDDGDIPPPVPPKSPVLLVRRQRSLRSVKQKRAFFLKRWWRRLVRRRSRPRLYFTKREIEDAPLYTPRETNIRKNSYRVSSRDMLRLKPKVEAQVLTDEDLKRESKTRFRNLRPGTTVLVPPPEVVTPPESRAGTPENETTGVPLEQYPTPPGDAELHSETVRRAPEPPEPVPVIPPKNSSRHSEAGVQEDPSAFRRSPRRSQNVPGVIYPITEASAEDVRAETAWEEAVPDLVEDDDAGHGVRGSLSRRSRRSQRSQLSRRSTRRSRASAILTREDVFGRRTPSLRGSVAIAEELDFDDPSKLDEALSFVNTWSTYLQRAIAVRVVLRKEILSWEQAEEEAWRRSMSDADTISLYSQASCSTCSSACSCETVSCYSASTASRSPTQSSAGSKRGAGGGSSGAAGDDASSGTYRRDSHTRSVSQPSNETARQPSTKTTMSAPQAQRPQLETVASVHSRRASLSQTSPVGQGPHHQRSLDMQMPPRQLSRDHREPLRATSNSPKPPSLIPSRPPSQPPSRPPSAALPRPPSATESKTDTLQYSSSVESSRRRPVYIEPTRPLSCAVSSPRQLSEWHDQSRPVSYASPDLASRTRWSVQSHDGSSVSEQPVTARPRPLSMVEVLSEHRMSQRYSALTGESNGDTSSRRSSSDSLTRISKPNNEAMWLRKSGSLPNAAATTASITKPRDSMERSVSPRSHDSGAATATSSSSTDAFRSLDDRGQMAQLRRGGINRKRNLHTLSNQLASSWRAEHDSDTNSNFSADSNSKIVSGAAQKPHLIEVPTHRREVSMTI